MIWRDDKSEKVASSWEISVSIFVFQGEAHHDIMSLMQYNKNKKTSDNIINKDVAREYL